MCDLTASLRWFNWFVEFRSTRPTSQLDRLGLQSRPEYGPNKSGTIPFSLKFYLKTLLIIFLFCFLDWLLLAGQRRATQRAHVQERQRGQERGERATQTHRGQHQRRSVLHDPTQRAEQELHGQRSLLRLLCRFDQTNRRDCQLYVRAATRQRRSIRLAR